MKFTLKAQGNIHNLMRQAGYYFEKEAKGEMVFSRPLSASRSGYPRFHIYLNVPRETSEAIFRLHLDQKKPSYGGGVSHSGEYAGDLVEKEAERIKSIIGA